MSDKTYEYDTVIQKVDGIDGAYVKFPHDLLKGEKYAGTIKKSA
jgi:hypothetical protein